jgi:hypothetical protein
VHTPTRSHRGSSLSRACRRLHRSRRTQPCQAQNPRGKVCGRRNACTRVRGRLCRGAGDERA